MRVNRLYTRPAACSASTVLLACGLIVALAFPAAAQQHAKKSHGEPARDILKSTDPADFPERTPFKPSDSSRSTTDVRVYPLVGPSSDSYGSSGDGYRPAVRSSSTYAPPTGDSSYSSSPRRRASYSSADNRGSSEPVPNAWDAASVPREAVLEWAMASTPDRDSLPELEALLERAYQTDPFVAEAQAQLQQAEAAVDRARMEVARKIVHTRAQWEIRRRTVQCLSDALKKTPEDDKLLQQYVDARAKLAQIEMELPFLAGRQPSRTRPDSGTRPYAQPQYAPQPAPTYNLVPPAPSWRPTPDAVPPLPAAVNPDIRKALQKTVDVQFEDTQFRDIGAFLGKETGVNFFMAAPDFSDVPITLNLKSVTLAAVFQAIEDAVPDVCFVVRPYGILVTARERAGTLGESEAIRALRQVEIMPGPPVQEPIPGPALPSAQPGPPMTFAPPQAEQPSPGPATPTTFASPPIETPTTSTTANPLREPVSNESPPLPEEPRSNWPRRKSSAR